MVYYISLLAKFCNLLDKIGEFCESKNRSIDGSAAQFELLQFLEARAYPSKGRTKKKKSRALFDYIPWVTNFISILTCL